VDVASDTANNNKLPSIKREEDILEYNVSKTIDLSYRIGILTRPEWRRIHRCYEIRRDLEHEDDEYEAVLEDCFYIFKTSIDVVLRKDPIELLKVTDAKDLVESSTNISVSEEFLTDFKSAPKGRQKEITEILVSFSLDEGKPDIVRENSVELLRHIKELTVKTVTIEIASILESKLGREGINLKVARVGHACGALGYFKRVRLIDFFLKFHDDVKSTGTQWNLQSKQTRKLEDIGGLRYCPKEHYENMIKELSKIYIGERSFGQYSSSRPVFYSNAAAPIIERVFVTEGEKARVVMEKLRSDRHIKHKLTDKHLLRRFENLLDECIEIEEVEEI